MESYQFFMGVLCMALLAGESFALTCYNCETKITNGITTSGEDCGTKETHLAPCNSVQDVDNKEEIKDVNVDKLVFVCDKEVKKIQNNETHTEFQLIIRGCVGETLEKFTEECIHYSTPEEIKENLDIEPDTDHDDDEDHDVKGTLESYELCSCKDADACNFSGNTTLSILALLIAFIAKLL